MFLSIIIPAHNEENRLPTTLDLIDKYLKGKKFEYEVVVVENGSHDQTANVVRDISKKKPYVHLIKVATRGKGLAVKAGMLTARGDYRFICDADLSMPIDELDNFLPPKTTGFDVVIASREGTGARRVGEPLHRHLMGRVLNFIIKTTALKDFEDTQCGFKLFTKKAAEDLFGVQRMTGIGFDIELMFIAKKRGYSIKQVPIVWYYNGDSRMRIIGDSLHILLEIYEIRRNWLAGVYKKIS